MEPQKHKEVKIIDADYKLTTKKRHISNQIEEEPRKIYVDNVCYWFEKKGYLIGSQKNKAKKFIQLGLLERYGQGFKCLPLPGNKTTHILGKINNEWTCTCQRNKGMGKICSHIDAIKLKLFMENWNNA